MLARNWSSLPVRERISLLMDVYRPGRTFSQMAGDIGPDVTRSMIAGLYNRHPDLREQCPPNARPSNGAVNKSRGGRQIRIVKRESKPLPEPTPEPHSMELTLDQLSGAMCAWPTRTDEMFHYFCGAAVSRGRYCAHHMARSIGPGTDSERRALRGIKG